MMLIRWAHVCLRDFKWGSHVSFWSKVSPSSFMLLTLFISTCSIYIVSAYFGAIFVFWKRLNLVL